MKQTTTTPIKLTAAKGKYLTQAADVDLTTRILTTSIALAVNDSAANWREIDEAEAESIKTAQQRAMEQRLKEMSGI